MLYDALLKGSSPGFNMYLLAIDTATNSGGVAISRNAEVIGLVMLKTPLSYAEKLVDYIDFLLESLDLKVRDINCLAVASGPGSFTGLRVGIASAKGLSQSLNIPCVGVSTLAALAHRFREVEPSISPLIDARRQQVYAALYEYRRGELTEDIAECVLPPHQWLKKLPEERSCLLVGDAAQLYSSTAAALRPGCRVLRTDNFILTSLCQMAFERFARGEFVDAAALKAHYIRPSDARVDA